MQIDKIKQVLPLLVNKNPGESSIEESKPSIDTQMFQFKGNIVSTYLHMNYKMLEIFQCIKLILNQNLIGYIHLVKIEFHRNTDIEKSNSTYEEYSFFTMRNNHISLKILLGQKNKIYRPYIL